jgi:hypothetical protein
MREKELKLKVQERRAALSDQSWAYLYDQGFVEDALTKSFDEEMVQYIIDRFDEIRAAFPQARSRARTEESAKEVPGTAPPRPEETERASAFEEYLAYAANFDKDLHRFRERVLGGRLLTAEEARALVQSPFARFFGDTRFDFGGGSVPLRGHHATLESYEREREGHRVRHRAAVSVDPPGITEIAEMWTYQPPHKVIRPRRNDDVGNGKPLSFVDAEGKVQVSWIWERSLLEKLLRLREKLAKRYLWQGAQATMFVLTGEIPARSPLRVSYEWKSAGWGGNALKASQGVLTLEVAPWVSANTVSRAYKSAQRRILQRNNRSIKEKNLRLFRFVTERLEPTGRFEDGKPRVPPGEEGDTKDDLIAYGAYEKKPMGHELVREWDALPWVQRNGWTYDSDTRTFWRDYNKTKRRLAYSAPPLR